MAKKEIKVGSVLDRLRKTSTLEHAAVLEDSKFFNEKDMIPTSIPALNLAMSGSICGGLVPGLTVWAGPSKHFKTSFMLIQIAAYLDKYKEAICIFYDSEFGSPQSYFKSFGIDPSRVLHCPITDIEALKFDIMRQLQEIGRDDKVIIGVDSIGNLASKKEVDDALEGSSKSDMTRAKQLKSLFRMVTPYLTIKNIPMICVNHTYKCGTADMQVRLPDGTSKSIADVIVGDSVMTELGPEDVSWVTSYDDAWVTDIEMDDGTTLSFTSGHRFKVNGEWKFVEDIKPGDDIECLS